MKSSNLNKKIVILIITTLFISEGIFAQTDNPIAKVAKEHMYPFTFDTSFRGEGWEKIKDEAKSHNYFLIGEDHGLAEIPIITKALVQHVDYDLFVTEIDSITASVSKHLATQTSTQIDSFHASNPSALSFYSAKEEFEIIEELAKSNSDIWGLDQVSLFSTGIVFRKLNQICHSKEAKEMTAQLAQRSDSLFLEATKKGNYDLLFILSSKKEVFDTLDQLLKNESQEAKNISNDIKSSWKIYNGVDDANHHTRISGMKSKLLNYYLHHASNGKKYKKVLYKFGAYHVGRSESIFGGYDVGNFVANIAEAEGVSSYHLMIVGKGGEMNSFLLAEGLESTTYDLTDKESELHGLLPLANLVNENKWVFFDLKPLQKMLRKGDLTIQNSLLNQTIRGYDGLIIIPKTTASRNYLKNR